MLTYLLVVAVFSAQLKQICVYVDFKINQDFIVEVLCVNKERPQVMCGGQCHLAKQLKKAESDQEGIPQNNKDEERRYELFWNGLAIQKSLGREHCCLSVRPKYSASLLKGFHSEIFQPPRA